MHGASSRSWGAVVATAAVECAPAAAALAAALGTSPLLGREATAGRVLGAIARARDASWTGSGPRRVAVVLAGHAGRGADAVRAAGGGRIDAAEVRELLADFRPGSEVAVVVDACGAGNFLRLPLRRERGLWVPDGDEGLPWASGARVHCLGSSARGGRSWSDALLPDLARLARAPGGVGFLWRGDGAHLERAARAGPRARAHGPVLGASMGSSSD